MQKGDKLNSNSPAIQTAEIIFANIKHKYPDYKFGDNDITDAAIYIRESIEALLTKISATTNEIEVSLSPLVFGENDKRANSTPDIATK